MLPGEQEMVKNFLKGKIVQEFGTQADFAAAVGIDETLVSRVIRGRRDIPAETRKQWAKVLKCDAQELFRDESKTGR